MLLLSLPNWLRERKAKPVLLVAFAFLRKPFVPGRGEQWLQPVFSALPGRLPTHFHQGNLDRVFHVSILKSSDEGGRKIMELKPSYSKIVSIFVN